MVKKPRFAPITLLILSTALTACYAKHFAKDESRLPPQIAVEPVKLAAGVAKAEPNRKEKENVARINPSDVVESFAKRLKDENFFTGVIFPYTELSLMDPDVILEISVRSNYDLQSSENLLKGIAVGFSLLLLQPLLPTEYDLSVYLAVRATTRDGRLIKEYQSRSDYRFQYTSLQPSNEAINQWHQSTVDHAIEGLINKIMEDRLVLLRAAGGISQRKRHPGQRSNPN